MIISLTFRSIFISIFLLFSLPVARFLFNISFLFINKCLPVKRLAHIHKSPQKFRHPVVFQQSDYFVMAFRLGCQVRSYMMMMMMMMMMMNCSCGMVDRRKAFSLISSRDRCQRFSPSRISDTPRAGFEPAQNLSSGLVE